MQDCLKKHTKLTNKNKISILEHIFLKFSDAVLFGDTDITIQIRKIVHCLI